MLRGVQKRLPVVALVIDRGLPSERRRFDDPVQAELRRIVESIYGPPIRRLPGLEIGRAYLNAAREPFRYGGDLVDVFHYGNGLTSLALVDITGHGIYAAMNAGLAKHALRAYASRGLNARESVRSLNRLCIENSVFEADDEFFATVFFGIVDAKRQTLQYVSAGHEAAFVLDGDRAIQLSATGPIIGLMDDDGAFDHGVIALADGSILAAVTDGFSEARNAERQFLGSEALVDIVEHFRAYEAEEQAEALTHCASDFAGERQHDDVAALVVKFDASIAA
jgi:sigma-B regulation protein RsbU (phosphoserine phosphatase)